MGGVCSTHRTDQICIFVRKLKATDHLDELYVDGSIILKWTIKK